MYTRDTKTGFYHEIYKPIIRQHPYLPEISMTHMRYLWLTSGNYVPHEVCACLYLSHSYLPYMSMTRTWGINDASLRHLWQIKSELTRVKEPKSDISVKSFYHWLSPKLRNSKHLLLVHPSKICIDRQLLPDDLQPVYTPLSLVPNATELVGQ